MGINSDGDISIYGFLNLEGGTNLNHNNLSNIDGGATSERYHLTSSEYVKVQELSNYTIGTIGNNGAIWPNIQL